MPTKTGHAAEHNFDHHDLESLRSISFKGIPKRMRRSASGITLPRTLMTVGRNGRAPATFVAGTGSIISPHQLSVEARTFHRRAQPLTTCMSALSRIAAAALPSVCLQIHHAASLTGFN